jgi:C4-dicarboxylate-specific signal transduction histidine kinase
MVTLSGSPPKAAMFSCTHLSAAIWSRRPKLAQAQSESFESPPWRQNEQLVALVQEQFEKSLESYKSIPYDVRDHYKSELEALADGYCYRQVLELVQNAADAILEHAAGNARPTKGRIVLQLSGNRLYAANTDAPLSQEGIIALLSARSSSKRQNQIGRFGIGTAPPPARECQRCGRC